MQRIVVLNAKGGCGKTTLATNLAACYASRGIYPALLDYDIQGSSLNWLERRTKHYPKIHGLNAHKRDSAVTRSWQMRMPTGVERIIFDTPSAATGSELTEYVRQANVIIMPVLPSPIDIHAATNFLKEIMLLGKMRTVVAANDHTRLSTRIGVVANRVQDNTQVYRPLQKFLSNLNIPFVTALHDSHYYSHAFVEGIGVHELSDERIHAINQQWQPLLAWLEDSPKYPSHPSTTSRLQFEQKYNL